MKPILDELSIAISAMLDELSIAISESEKSDEEFNPGFKLREFTEKELKCEIKYHNNSRGTKVYTIKIIVSDILLENFCGEYYLLHMNPFLFHDGLRTRIPCEIIDEKNFDENEVPFTEYILELDSMITHSLDFKANELNVVFLSKEKKEGQAHIKIFFTQ